MRYIEVERVSGDELHKQEWTFIFDRDRMEIRLTSYRVMERKTKRHKFTVDSFFNIYNIHGSPIACSDVPLPDDVCDEALQICISKIKVVKE
jgi:hypothetical protein